MTSGPPGEKRLPGANLGNADLRGADLRGADLTGADLHGADLRGADLRRADLRGAYMDDADLSLALLHGTDLRGTVLGRGSLGHDGGDPELTWFYNPAFSRARADDQTRWPIDFSCVGKDIIFEGPAVLALEGEPVDLPAEDSRRLEQNDRRRSTTGWNGRVRGVHGWAALVETGGGAATIAGDRLLVANLHLLRGQPARYQDQWWTVVGADPADATVALERGSVAVTAPVAALFSRDNVCRWWWHVPGAERTEYS